MQSPCDEYPCEAPGFLDRVGTMRSGRDLLGCSLSARLLIHFCYASMLKSGNFRCIILMRHETKLSYATTVRMDVQAEFLGSKALPTNLPEPALPTC